MAEKEELQEQAKRFFINGKALQGELSEAGELTFTERLIKSDGAAVDVVQKIDVPADLFEKEELEIKFATVLSSIEPGLAVPVKFEVIKGNLYPGDQILIQLSKTGNQKNDFETVLTLAYDRRDFSFRSPANGNSENCYLRLLAVADKEILSSALSNQFSIQKAVPRLCTLSYISGLIQGEEKEVAFVFSHPAPVAKFEVHLISVTPRITRKLEINIPGNERKFIFSVPTDLEGNQFRLFLVAKDFNDNILSPPGRSNPFKIIKKEQGSPDINLDLPLPGAKLHAGTPTALRWRINAAGEKNVKTKVQILYTVENKEYLIEEREDAGSAVTIWTIPKNIPDQTSIMITLQMSNFLVRKEFGPFIIVNATEPIETEGDAPTQELTMLEQLLKQGLSLPKRSLFAFGANKTLNVAQFASYMIYAQKSGLRTEIQQKVPVIISRLEALKTELEREKYSEKNSITAQIFKEFMQVFTEIENDKRHFLQLNDPKRMKEIQDMGSFSLIKVKENAEFETLFNKNFTPRLEAHDWERICIDPNKLAFLFQTKDTYNVTTITHLFNFFEGYYAKLILLDGLFNRMKKILTQMRKSLEL